mgnify:CR=1 FL=1
MFSTILCTYQRVILFDIMTLPFYVFPDQHNITNQVHEGITNKFGK